jgi:hypothetical protein
MPDNDERTRRPPPEGVEGFVPTPVSEPVTEIPAVGTAESQEENGSGAGEEDGGDRRPTPVRMGIEAGEDAEDLDQENTRVVKEVETEIDWIVRVSGRSASGVIPLRTIPLMELTFSRLETPNEPLRRVLHHGETLARIPDHELLSLLGKSEPFREPMTVPEQPPQKRRKGGNRPPPGG